MDSRLQDKIRAGESKVLEFKEILPQGDKIAKTVVAFSNTSGGQLIIGVGDDRTIKGIDPDVDQQFHTIITDQVDSMSGIKY